MPETKRDMGIRFCGRGFTLIELLVVISIISMLMSIMLPGLNNAREMGRRVVCQSNIRQLTTGWYSYSLSNDDGLFSPDTEFNQTERDNYWVSDGPYMPGNTIGGTEEAIELGSLAPYLSYTTGVYKCKADKSELVRSYSISNTMGGRKWANTCSTYGGAVNIRRPAKRAVFIDADSLESSSLTRQWIGGGFFPIDWRNKTWDTKTYNNITARHLDGCNVSFADTHVEYRKLKDSRTIALANWDDSYNGTADNIDLDWLAEVLAGPGERIGE